MNVFGTKKKSTSVHIAKDRLTKFKQPLKMMSIMKKDVLKLDDIDEYFGDRMGYQKSKK